MQSGCSLPVADIGTGPGAAQTMRKWPKSSAIDGSAHHKRIAGRSAAEHLAAITRYRAAATDLLWVPSHLPSVEMPYGRHSGERAQLVSPEPMNTGLRFAKTSLCS